MFNTIKSKILVITFSMLIILVCVLCLFSFRYYIDTEKIMLNNVSNSIATQAQNINKELVKIEKNARSLALMGELYYKFDRDKNIAEKTVIQVFENYPESLGGGIWFKPYVVNKSKKLDCLYAYRNKQNEIVSDKSFESEEYNYPKQNWYKEIMPHVSKDHNIEWSSPYLEKIGSNALMITAGVGIYDNQENLVGISTVDWEIHAVVNAIMEIKNNLKLSDDCFALFAYPEKDYVIVTTDKYLIDKNIVGKSLKNVPWYRSNLKNVKYFKYHGKVYTPFVKELDNGMEFILCIPKWEMIYSKIVIPTVVLLGILLGISILMVSCLYAGLKGNILKPIGKLIYIANKIGRGENDVEIKIDKPEEFAKLASTFDKMTKDIKTVTKENERINSELSIAHSIQASSLPDKFPAFPDNDEFDIFASMKPAKEIGGDFYDFYFIDDDNLMFLIADVSGKGVPAALFMMTVKTLISNLSQLGYSPKDLAKTINKKICENNKRGFFVTMLTGIVNIKTGNIYLINCGHNKPLIKRKGAVYEYVDLPSNIALGVFENSDFEIYETSLAEGDILFTYTDGITEALNSNDEMYGEERLIEVLNKNSDLSDIKGIASSVGKNVEEYAQQIPQSDDITMLIFSYKNGRIKTFKTSAKIENYKPFYSWLHEILTEWNIDNELINKIDMCSEEIFANIAFYAYPEKNGDMEVSISKNSDKIKLVFKDEGIPYNPLEKQDPDITLPPEERPVGGLGIYMVKQMADSVSYEYMNGQNILTIIISV